MPTVDELLGPESETVDSLLGSSPEPEPTRPAATHDKTLMSQLAAIVPQIIAEHGGADKIFESPRPGETPEQTRFREGINEEMKKSVLRWATQRINESAMAGVGRSAQQVGVGVVESIRSPEGLALGALAAVQPELGVPAMVVRGAQATSAGAMSGILAKQAGQTAGSIAGGGVKTAADWTREILNMGLATLGTGAAFAARARALGKLEPAEVAAKVAPLTTAAVQKTIPFQSAAEHAVAAPSRLSVIREAGKPEAKGGIPAAEEMLEILPEPTVEQLAINELTRSTETEMARLVAEEGAAIRRTGEAVPKPAETGAIPTGALPAAEMMAQEPAGIRMTVERAVEEAKGGLPTAEPTLDLLPAAQVEQLAINQLTMQGIERGRATQFVESLGDAIRRQEAYPRAVAEKIAQQIAEGVKGMVHPNKPMTANQLKITYDSLTKAITENRLSEERPGVISGSKLEKWADGQIQEGRGRLNVGLDPVQLAAYAVKGAAILERGITTAAEWTAAMIKEHGEAIRPYLDKIRYQSDNLRQATLAGAEKITMAPAKPSTKPVAQVNVPTTLGDLTYYRVNEGAEIKGSDGFVYKAGDMISAEDLAKAGYSVGPPIGGKPPSAPVVPFEDLPDKPDAGSGIGNWLSRFLTKERGLSDEAYQAELKRRGAIQENATQAKYAVRDLTRAVGEETGQGVGETAVFGLRNASPELIRQIDDVLHGAADPNSLPEAIREPVVRMRAHIDALSSQLQGLVGDELAAVIEKNKGVYLTRSHRVFEDPKWVYDNVPVDVRNNAKRIVQNELNLTDAQAESYLRDLFQDWKQNGVQQAFNARRLGAKDLSILMKRKDISPEFQALMGTYQDPFVNYMRSVSKMSRLVADQQFLNQIRDMGMGKFLFKDGENPAGFNTLIAGVGSDAMSPLNGLRTSEHIARVFNEWGRISKVDNPLLKGYLAVNAATKGAKTIYSVMTQARNMQQFWFWMANGHYRVSALKESVGTILSDIGLMTDNQFRAYHQKLARLNLLDESAYGSELRDMISDFSKKLSDQNVSPMDYSLANGAKAVFIKAPQKAYQLADEFGKIVGFEAEKARVMRDNPNMPLDAIEAEAAFRIRNTYPTYTNIPVWMRQFRRFPLVGPFISFPYEVFRTVGHGLNYLRQDLEAGNWRSATERGAGLLTAVGGLTFGLQALSRHLNQISEKDDRDLRSQLPPWEKNSTLLFTGHEPGKVRYFNLSYNNPYNYFSDPLVAVYTDYRDEGKLLDSLATASGEFLQPWASEQMLASALIDVKRNTDRNGRNIWNPQASTETKIEAGIGHIWHNALEPGTLTRLQRRIIPAFEGPPKSQSTPTREIVAELTGYREKTHDFVESLRYRAQDFVTGIRDSTLLFTDGVRNPARTVDLIAQYKAQEEARFRIYQQLARDIQVVRRQGGSLKDIAETLHFSGVGKETAEEIMAMKYRPYTPGKELIEAAKRAGHPMPVKEIEALIKERAKLVLNP